LLQISPEKIVPKARILLADDHALVAEAFKRLLEPEFEVVGTVGDGHSLLRAASVLRPDVVLLDVYMPLVNGLDAGRQLKSAYPSIKIIVLTINDDVKTAAASLRDWASAYLLKKSTGSELLTAMREVLRGCKYVALALQKELAELDLRKSGHEAGSALTSRQREVLRVLAGGYTMKEAAMILQVSTRTVAFHKYRIMRDFGVKTNSALLRFAIKQKVVSPN
jgi:DNA-binding NarL/FixJ family response regulator